MKWVRRLVCAPIRLYQKFISPCLGHNCRFLPTCSQYAIEAIMVHGVLKGGLLAMWRILRCNPWGGLLLSSIFLSPCDFSACAGRVLRL